MFVKPEDVTKKQFTFTRGTYNANEVNDFLKEVAKSYAIAYEESEKMRSDYADLKKKVQEYEELEDDIKKALIVAQKTAKQMTEEAKEKCAAMLREAEQESEQKKAETLEKCEQAIRESEKQVNEIIEKSQEEINKLQEQCKELHTKRDELYFACKVEVDKLKKRWSEQLQESNSMIDMLFEEFEKGFNDTEQQSLQDIEVVEETADNGTEAESE